MIPPTPPKLHLRGFFYAWCNLFLIWSCWAPLFWFSNHERVRSAWEFHKVLGSWTAHELVSALLTGHGLLIMCLFIMQLSDRE